jgi:predicted CoA-binding protein
MPDDVTNAQKILASAKKILLVDWPDTAVPRTLINAGFTVFCYSPNGYTKAELKNEYPADINPKEIFAPKDNEKGFLIFHPLTSAPGSVDIINVYRPEEEHADIIKKQVLPLHTKVLWLQSSKSDRTRSLANDFGLTFVEGHDIAEVARNRNA